jgi:AcrR family transcriptional regulator
MGRPRANAADTATPERILDAAAAEFAEHGFARATLADIARRAGIRRPSLLYHFDSKERLYAAVVRAVFARLTEVLHEPMGLDRPFVARLEALVRAYATFLASHPQHARIVVREMLEDDGPGTVILREEVAPVLAGVVAFLEHAGAGVLRPGLPLRSAVMQVAADVLLQNASGAIGPTMWGERSADRTWALTSGLLLAGSTPPPASSSQNKQENPS